MIKLLVVDDEVLTRTILRKIIEENFPSDEVKVIGEAKNGTETIVLIDSHRPDIVLMDIKLPGLSGLEVTQEIKKVYPHMKIIMITAYDKFEFAQKAVQLGAYDYILKPCLAENLLPVINNAMRDIRIERQKKLDEDELKEKLREVMPFIKISLGYDLLSGTGFKNNDLRSRLEFVGEKGLPSMVMVAYIDQFMESGWECSEAEKQHLKNQVYQSINETLCGTNSFSLPLSRDEFVIYIVDEEKAPEQVKNEALQIAENIRAAVENNTEVTVTIGVGNYYNIEKLHRSYKEASQAYQLGSFFLGSNYVIHSGQIEGLMHNKNRYPLNLEPLLIDSIKIGDLKDAIIAGHDIIKSLLANNSLQSTKYYLNGLITILSRTVAGTEGSFKDLSEQNIIYLTKLARIDSDKDLYNWLEEVVESHINYHFQKSTETATNAVRRVLEYIEENYHREITLHDISGVLYINPVYFCRLFKAKMGVTFIEHLTQFRLKKAKELLTFTNLDIREIAEKVGFSNANYFSRVFKKHKNMTPSSYRTQKKSKRSRQ